MNLCESSSSESNSFLSVSESDDSFSSIPSTGEFVNAQFSDVSGNFNVVHINAQSIPAHYSDMLATFDCNNLHAILVSESWLKPCLSSISYNLPNFRLIRNDRAVGGGGGVAIYLRDNIPYKIASKSAQPPPPNAGEHIFLELLINHSKVLLGVYYSPSLHVNFFSSFEKMLEDLLPSYGHCIIMGDFNTCLLKQDSRSLAFKSIVESCHLSILPLSATHLFPNCIPSLLDLILVSSPQFVTKHGQFSADAFSFHDLIFLSYKIRTPKSKPKILLQRNFSGMNVDDLLKDATDIDWTPLLQSSSVDDKVRMFTSKLIDLYDLHAPVRPIKVKHFPAPWLTKEIKLLLTKKATAKRKYTRRSDTFNRDKYISIRNHCNKVCRDAQRRHIHDSIKNNNATKVWKFLRSLGVGKTKNTSLDSHLDLDSLNFHFSTSASIHVATKESTLNYLSELPAPDHPPFVFTQFTDCDVKKSITDITSKAVGSDYLSRSMVLPILDTVLPIITHILNYSVNNGSFPSNWKEAEIIPIPKKSNPISFSDYRPISILPFLSKVLERLVNSQLTIFLNTHSLFNPLQSGFRPGHSTTTALIKVTDDIRHGMELGKVTILTLLDFSNAFNTVDFDILLGMLCSLNISPTVIQWFRSYLFGRRQRIRVEDAVSTWCNTSAGVPQGGVLSPLLFALFINSISNKLHSSYHLYADDLQIYTQTTIDNLSNAIDLTNQDLIHISGWSKAYGLTVNPSKTQSIAVGSSRMISKINFSSLPQIVFEGVSIPFNDKVKNLGIFIDSTLSWSPQLQEVSRKIFASAASLRRLRNFLPHNTKIELVQSLLLPILDYADASYLDLTEIQLDKLERLQNFCIRFIFGLRKYDHVSEFRTKLKWLPIRLRRNAHILSLLYNILFSPKTPFYLKERFKYLYMNNTRYLRSSENLKLATPINNTRLYGKSFTVQSVGLWNALPESIRRAQSLHTFNGLVKDHYLSTLSS